MPRPPQSQAVDIAQSRHNPRPGVRSRRGNRHRVSLWLAVQGEVFERHERLYLAAKITICYYNCSITLPSCYLRSHVFPFNSHFDVNTLLVYHAKCRRQTCILATSHTEGALGSGESLFAGPLHLASGVELQLPSLRPQQQYGRRSYQ